MRNLFNDKRRNFYIKKDFQRKFILKFSSLVLIGVVISGVIIYTMSSRAVTTTFANSRLVIKSAADYILPSVIFSSVIVMLVVGIATIIFTLLMSHRIGGALYAIERNVEKVASGDLRIKFHLRGNDEIKPLAVALDVMVYKLREDVERVKRLSEEAEAALSSMDKAYMPSDLADKFCKIKEELKKFST